MKNQETLTSKEAKKTLKISDCKLMHLREDGVLKASKKGNAFLYSKKDVEKYLKLKDLKK